MTPTPPSSSSRAHPRSRGDHHPPEHCPAVRPGSSPLARGPQALTLLTLKRIGLIPARAGTTKRNSVLLAIPRAHPRSRGDHERIRMNLELIDGSSPLARGPRFGGASGLDRVGLIPARAGTTFPTLTYTLKGGAHPRSRGDHVSSSVRSVI